VRDSEQLYGRAAGASERQDDKWVPISTITHNLGSCRQQLGSQSWTEQNTAQLYSYWKAMANLGENVPERFPKPVLTQTNATSLRFFCGILRRVYDE